MSSKLNVIALISGGKDSLFSILHCLANEHRVVAIANLYPQEQPLDGGEDIDSYMYQTVGHSIVPLYEEALGIPLYRQPIRGSAINTSSVYAPAAERDVSRGPVEEDDETESLVPLLRRVVAAHPDADALSTGAILSTYQRTRVESVALRLGLTPLSYLWQYPSLPPYTQTALLTDMRAVGQRSRIVKVASGGLDEGFLWEDVSDERVVRKLQTRMARFGAGDGAVLGEGGEFETLALDGPDVLWKRCIQVDVKEIVRGGGGSAVVRLGQGKAVEKIEASDSGSIENLRIPALLDDEFERLLQILKEDDKTTVDVHHESCEDSLPDPKPAGSNEEKPPGLADTRVIHSTDTTGFWSCVRSDNTLCISNMICTTREANTRKPEAQMARIVHRLLRLLRNTYHIEPSSIVSSTLLLRSMADFTAINPVYGSLFTEPSPPARVTVACGDTLPDEVEVMLSVVVDLGSAQARKGLHVQSRSYWAPANIGPYSQAVAVPVPSRDNTHLDTLQQDDARLKMVYVAGQIPLVPASMELVRDEGAAGFRLQTVLALQHLWRIGRAMSVVWWTAGVAFISRCDGREATGRVATALEAWTSIHRLAYEEQNARLGPEDEDTVDVWDMKHGMGARAGTDSVTSDNGRPPLPDYSRVLAPPDVAAVGSAMAPPCIVVQVDELPRGADIEWTSLGLAPGGIELQVTQGIVTGAGRAGSIFQWVAVAVPTDVDAIGQGEVILGQYTVYAAQPLPAAWLERAKPRVIPCRAIWSDDGRELAAVVAVARSQLIRS